MVLSMTFYHLLQRDDSLNVLVTFQRILLDFILIHYKVLMILVKNTYIYLREMAVALIRY
jgi:hypothetical protein